MTTADRADLRTRREPLGANLADRILEWIREQDLSDGDPLPSEKDLSETFGASMRVVRDALRVLSQQGAIRTSQGRRAEVSELRPIAVGRYFRLMLDTGRGALQDFVEFRMILEITATGIAAQRATDAQLDDLSETLDRIEKLGGDRIPERAELDLAFHLGIANCTGNQFLTATLEALTEVLETERQLNMSATESMGRTHRTSDSEHRALLTALKSHDVVQSEQLMRSHLERVRRELLDWQGQV